MTWSWSLTEKRREKRSSSEGPSRKEKVLIEKINFVKRHARPHGKQRQGGILEKEAPLHISNVMLLCEKCNKPIRIGHRVLEDGKKARFCRKCGELLDK